MPHNVLRLAALLAGLLLFNAAGAAEFILTSAPRDTAAKEKEIYDPIAKLLSKATGHTITFRHGDNYLVYPSEMRKGTYDIILDGPHFVGWRMAKLGHVPLVKFPGNLSFVVIVKKDNARVNDIKDLTGRTLCALPSPNLANVVVTYEFDNPARQPLTLEEQSFPEIYKGVMKGKCVGGIMQGKLFQDLDKEARGGKVIYTSKPLPNQAFTAGPRVTADMREKISQALLSPEGAIATQKLREVFKIQNLVPVNAEEYQGLGKYLRDVWGFDQ